MWAEFGQVLYTLLVRMGMGIEQVLNMGAAASWRGSYWHIGLL
jgi:hypothetical protein